MSTRDRILAEIERREQQHEPPPTLRELADAGGVKSVSTVKLHLDTLRRYRLITWTPRLSRTVRLVRHAG